MHQRFNVGNMRQGQDFGPVNLLIMGHIMGDHREAHINPAKEGLDCDHFGHIARGLKEFIKGARVGFIQRKAQRDLNRIAQGRPANLGMLAAQNAGLLQLLKPAREGRRRHPCPLGKLSTWAGRIRLKLAENPTVCIRYLHEKSEKSKKRA